MKNTKKALLMTLCAVMLVAASVMGTMAYLTSTTDVVTNTFTVGNVAITLDEAKVDVYGDEIEGEDRVQGNQYKLIPGHNYAKDPTVHVTAGSEECYLFVKVENGIAGIETGTTIEAQMKANNWTKLNGNVWYYNTTVDALEAEKDIDVVVFEEFTVAGTADVAANTDKTITVVAYAVQADGFADAAAAWAAAPAQW